MSTELLHGQMSVVDDNGNVTILHQETSASDVLVNNENNTQGASGGSAIPSDVNTLQKLIDKIGELSFKSKIGSSELHEDLIVNNYTMTEEGHVLDARAGKDLNDRVHVIEDSNYVYIEESEDAEIILPESEINDNIVSETLTWSSEKINDILQQIFEDTHIFYIPLIENASESYVSQKTVEEIEEAYQANYPIWVVASDIFLPLAKRLDANNWIFSGYAEGRAYDIQISNDGVSITYAPVATLYDALPNPNVLKVKGVVNAVYDGSEEVEIEIPEVIKDNETGIETTWSSEKINESITGLQTKIENIKTVDPDGLSPVATSGSFNDLKHKPSFVMYVDDEGVLKITTIYSFDEVEYHSYSKIDDETGLDITQAVSATVNNNELEVN